MKNVADTETYTIFDHVLSKTVRSLSHVVGLRKITQPFWARWLASGIRPEVIFQFLDELGTIDGWATAAARIVGQEIRRFQDLSSSLPQDQRAAKLRELSYICNLAQWGSLPITEDRKRLYAQCRDFYIEAESLVFAQCYRRIDIPFEDVLLHANLHVPEGQPKPLIVIIHGVDGCKEEFLATELALLEQGFAVLGFDGPGQGEALLLDGIHWRKTFPSSVSAAIDAVQKLHVSDTSSVGLLGISIGGMWALQASAQDPRVTAVYDLGGPINTLRRYSALPFLIKTRICQVTGATDINSVRRALAENVNEDEATLNRITASVRMLHGSRDRVVSIADKEWLLAKLKSGHPERLATLRVLEGGDHCCTNQADVVREDMITFFKSTLG